MAAPLSLTCSLSTSVLPAGGKPHLVYLLVEISGGEGTKSLPSNLGFVIDVSDSMRIRLVTDQQFNDLLRNGQAREVMTDGVPAYQITAPVNEMMTHLPRRLDYVRQALSAASGYIRPGDYFSLVAFGGQAARILPATPGRESARLRQAALDLEALRLGDGTQMAEGLALAFDEIQRQAARGYAARLILLTDGHTQNVSEVYTWARLARQAGVRLSTLGIGAEFNEELLIPLADLTGGNAYYIETPERIPLVFREELGAALGVSYQNLEVKLQLPRGVSLRQVYRVRPDLGLFDPGPDLGRSYALLVGDYAPEEPVALLIELIAPPWAEATYRLAQVLLAWDDPDDPEQRPNQRPNQRQDVVVEVSSKATAYLDNRVMNLVEKAGVYRAGAAALEAARQADQQADAQERGSATLRLRQAATRLLDMGETNLATAMFQQASLLEQSGHVEPEAAKKLRYETRRLTQTLEE